MFGESRHRSPTRAESESKDGQMACGRVDAVVISDADRLIHMSEQAKLRGDREGADRLLLLAWMAYDGQDVTIDELETVSFQVQGRDTSAESALNERVERTPTGAS
jgi:hypothetical protein